MKDSYRIVVSDIVKSLVNTTNRDVLQTTMHLDNRIAQSLIDNIVQTFDQEYAEHVVVDGIRQVTIVDRLLNAYPDARLVWLEVPYDERKRRYEARKDIKDVESFELADNKAIELECQKIFDTFRDKLTIINNY